MRGEPRSIRTTQSRGRFLRVTSVCPTSNLARSVVLLVGSLRSSRASLSTSLSSGRASDHDGARVPGPREGRVPDRDAGGAARIECVRLGSRTLTTFPSSASRRHPAVAGAIVSRGGALYERDGPAEVSAPTCSREGARLPGDQGAFHHHEHEVHQDFSWTPRAGLLFAPPTRSPQAGEKCRWSGIASLGAPVPGYENRARAHSRLGERAPL